MMFFQHLESLNKFDSCFYYYNEYKKIHTNDYGITTYN